MGSRWKHLSGAEMGMTAAQVLQCLGEADSVSIDVNGNYYLTYQQEGLGLELRGPPPYRLAQLVIAERITTTQDINGFVHLAGDLASVPSSASSAKPDRLRMLPALRLGERCDRELAALGKPWTEDTQDGHRLLHYNGDLAASVRLDAQDRVVYVTFFCEPMNVATLGRRHASGVELGMTAEQVSRCLGSPDKERTDSGRDVFRIYTKDGLGLRLRGPAPFRVVELLAARRPSLRVDGNGSFVLSGD
jgi:hypothetical protein